MPVHHIYTCIYNIIRVQLMPVDVFKTTGTIKETDYMAIAWVFPISSIHGHIKTVTTHKLYFFSPYPLCHISIHPPVLSTFPSSANSSLYSYP